MHTNKPIYVTQPFLPPLEDFIPYLEKIWENKWLTNGGPFHQELEKKLADYLGVEYLSLFSNGTIALVTALQALQISGEVITTPFSFVATSHSLIWNGITPVFVDIDYSTFNLNPDKIEAAITKNTSAILPVHVYGRPCDVDKIQCIAAKHGLKIIYDAAHAFGVRYKNNSILKYGDLSILSFHATKVFNTFEGGAIICPDAATKNHIDNLKNFGFVDEVTVVAPGINGKMNEVQSAFGLLQLEHIDDAIEKRRSIDRLYREKLSHVKGISFPDLPNDVTSNYSYFPIIVEPDYELSRDELYDKLRQEGIYARRYFYPLISDLPIYQHYPSALADNLPEASSVSSKVLCLPMYSQLLLEDVNSIISIIY